VAFGFFDVPFAELFLDFRARSWGFVFAMVCKLWCCRVVEFGCKKVRGQKFIPLAPSLTWVGEDSAPPKSSPSGLRLIFQTYKMGIEEQQEEREVLEAIFPEEITGW
jgi:hypothetical protein